MKKKTAAKRKTPSHQQVVIRFGRRSVKVDKGLAELLLALWQRGFRTIGSCQQELGTIMAWISFYSLKDAKRFQRLSRGTIFVPTAQHFAEASKASYEEGYSVPGMVGVAFSCTDIPAVLKAVRNSR